MFDLSVTFNLAVFVAMCALCVVYIFLDIDLFASKTVKKSFKIGGIILGAAGIAVSVLSAFLIAGLKFGWISLAGDAAVFFSRLTLGGFAPFAALFTFPVVYVFTGVFAALSFALLIGVCVKKAADARDKTAPVLPKDVQLPDSEITEETPAAAPPQSAADGAPLPDVRHLMNEISGLVDSLDGIGTKRSGENADGARAKNEEAERRVSDVERGSDANGDEENAAFLSDGDGFIYDRDEKGADEGDGDEYGFSNDEADGDTARLDGDTAENGLDDKNEHGESDGEYSDSETDDEEYVVFEEDDFAGEGGGVKNNDDALIEESGEKLLADTDDVQADGGEKYGENQTDEATPSQSIGAETSSSFAGNAFKDSGFDGGDAHAAQRTAAEDEDAFVDFETTDNAFSQLEKQFSEVEPERVATGARVRRGDALEIDEYTVQEREEKPVFGGYPLPKQRIIVRTPLKTDTIVKRQEINVSPAENAARNKVSQKVVRETKARAETLSRNNAAFAAESKSKEEGSEKKGESVREVEPVQNVLPVTKRHVLLNRRNVVNMFSEYLKSKNEDEKEKIESSINTIIIK